jgi:hypothetical protein
MKFKDKTKGGYPVRCIAPKLSDTDDWSVWAVNFLDHEYYFIYDRNGVQRDIVEGRDGYTFNLVPDSPTEDNEAQDELYMEHIEARICKLEDEQATHQDDINAINRELAERLDPALAAISELKSELALMKKILEQTVDVNKMGTELTTFDKLKAGLDELVEDSQRYEEERWGDRGVWEWKWEVYNKRSFITEGYYTEEEIHKFPNIEVKRRIPETERGRV